MTGARADAESARSEAAGASQAVPAMALRVRDIHVRFAGVVAVDGVCLEAQVIDLVERKVAELKRPRS